MNNLVKNAFLVLMGAVVAFILYILLFGTTDLNGNQMTEDKLTITGVGQVSQFKGALWYAAEAMEEPIAKYYYSYCFLPAMHKDDYVDEALGITVSNKDKDMFKTNADLSTDTPTSVGNRFRSYQTGWK